MARYSDGKFKNFLATALLFCAGTIPAVAEPALVPLPGPGFELNRTRSDSTRRVREFRTDYRGPVFDAQAHIRRPGRRDGAAYLEEIIETVGEAGVTRMLVMATPNEGRRASHEKEARYRQRLRRSSGGRVGVICGGNYSYWLHRAFRDGYEKSRFEWILAGLGRGIEAGHCAGLGEIGLFHFNKNGHQPVISYAPNFAPFLKLERYPVRFTQFRCAAVWWSARRRVQRDA